MGTKTNHSESHHPEIPSERQRAAPAFPRDTFFAGSVSAPGDLFCPPRDHLLPGREATGLTSLWMGVILHRGGVPTVRALDPWVPRSHTDHFCEAWVRAQGLLVVGRVGGQLALAL